TGDNTNLKGALIANITNASSLRGAEGDAAIHFNSSAIDGGNLILNSNSQLITKNTITNSLNVSITIDNRIIAGLAGNKAALDSLSSDQRNLGRNLAITAKAQAQLLDAPLVAADIILIPFYFRYK
ncbi:MAG: hypothetical protein KGP29_07920, partial [Proteobacteria bacterium]|nr:hypothetical protein [Pseudomonadota bacterium]